MTFSTSQLETDHAAILDDMKETATFSGKNYTCNRVSMSAQMMQARERDFIESYRFSLSFSAADFTTAPEQDDTLAYDGTTWRVLSTDLSPDGKDLRVHLTSEYGNA